jgi:hypothetical protein
MKPLAVTLVAAGVVLAVAACGGGGPESAGPVSTVPADSGRVGFIGLPPEGATPSTPESGEVVLTYFGPNPGHDGKSRLWLYADGRLVWLWDGNHPKGANDWSTGFLEQRLTPEGVDLLVGEAVSIGHWSHQPPPPPPPRPCAAGEAPGTNGCQPPSPRPLPDEPLTVPFYVDVWVPGLGRLGRVDRARDLDRLVARVADPASWLPARAWGEREIAPYVPSRFSVCYGGWPPDQPIEPSRLLSLLPEWAGDLLGSKGRTPREGLFMKGPGDIQVVTDHCSEVTTEDARALAEALDDAGLERFMPNVRLAYRFEAPGPSEAAGHIYFEPYLPHGEFICSACG